MRAKLCIQVVRQQRLKLKAKQAAFCQHTAALLDVIAKIRLERVVCDDDRLAEQRAAFCPADCKHIAQPRQIRQRHAAVPIGQRHRQARAVQIQPKPVGAAKSGKLLELPERIRCADLGRIRYVNHLRLDHMLVRMRGKRLGRRLWGQAPVK